MTAVGGKCVLTSGYSVLLAEMQGEEGVKQRRAVLVDDVTGGDAP